MSGAARVLFPLFAAGFAVLVALTPPGFFSIDEVIYHAAAVAVARDGALTIENGYGLFGSQDLRVAFLIDGPGGLVPQYPAGTALLGAPFVAVFGVRGLMVLNALAALGVLAFTWSAARAMFPARRVAAIAVALTGGASFLAEYAAGVWPHAIAAFFVAGAVAFAARALSGDPRGSANQAVAAGFMVGAGLLFRVDVVLILPAIAALAILYAPRPVAMVLAGALGMAPGLALASWLNLRKFETWMPVSYGSDGGGGGIDMTTYLPLAGVGLLGLAGLIAVRGVRWTPGRRAVAAAAVVAAIAAAVALGPGGGPVQAYLSGAYALVVDLTGLPRYKPGIWELMPGVVTFWGATKKALGLSLPWIGVLGALPFLLVLRRDRASGAERGWILFLAIAVAVWTAPFFLRSWHGGLSSNLRYFLPILPLLAILSAWVWDRLRRWGGLSPATLAALAILGAGSVFGFAASHPGGLAAAQQIWPQPVFWAVAVAAALAGLASGRWGLARLAEAALAFGAGLAVVFGWLLDPGFATTRRAASVEMRAITAALPAPVLLYGPPEFLTTSLGDPARLVAIQPWEATGIDRQLLRDASDAGYRVFLHESFADGLEEIDPGFERTGSVVGIERLSLIEVRPVAR